MRTGKGLTRRKASRIQFDSSLALGTTIRRRRCAPSQGNRLRVTDSYSHDPDAMQDIRHALLLLHGFCGGLLLSAVPDGAFQLGSLRVSKHSCKGPMPGSKDQHTAERTESRSLTSGVSSCFCTRL